MAAEVTVVCKKCGAEYEIDPSRLGKVKCGECDSKDFEVKGTSAKAAAPAKAPEAPAKAAPAPVVPATPAAPAAPAAPAVPAAAAAKAPEAPAKAAPAPAVPATPAAPAAPAVPAVPAAVPAAAAAKAPEAPAKAAPGLAKVRTDAGDRQGVQDVRTAYQALTAEVGKVVVGQQEVVDQVLIAILVGGHCLLEGVPGLAKTLLISSIAEAMHLRFKRIQFTPDLMPSDITGTEVIQEDPATGKRSYQFMAGPIFANIILADEINRTPPKTQAAMLEAMQERQVSIGGTVHKLEMPFFVMATQNPLDQEGTYPLPEAQQDRFLFKVLVGYPTDAEEKSIVQMVTSQSFQKIQPVLDGKEVLAAQQIIRRIPIADTVVDYATRLVRATRLRQPETPQFITEYVAWGCGPRASIALVAASKAAAAIRGAEHVAVEDLQKVTHPILRHRMAVNYTARAKGLDSDAVIDMLLEAVPPYNA